MRAGRSRESPPDQSAAPGEPGADARTKHEVAVADAAVVDRREQRERYRRRRRVAVALDVGDRALAFEAEALGRGFDDAEIRLVRPEPRDVADRDTCLLQRGVARLDDCAHGAAEYF